MGVFHASLNALLSHVVANYCWWQFFYFRVWLLLVETRALQSTYPARCIFMYLRAACRSSIDLHVCWQPLPTYARRVVRMSRKHMACMPVAWVGAVDRHGQQKRTVYDVLGPCLRNRSILKPVFHRFRRIHCDYEPLRCLDLEMWRFSCRWQTTTQNRLLYPLRMRVG